MFLPCDICGETDGACGQRRVGGHDRAQPAVRALHHKHESRDAFTRYEQCALEHARRATTPGNIVDAKLAQVYATLALAMATKEGRGR